MAETVKSAGRPSIEDPREHRGYVTLSTAENERIQWALQETGMPLNIFLRYAALKVAREVIG